jgi:hypothetical protein
MAGYAYIASAGDTAFIEIINQFFQWMELRNIHYIVLGGAIAGAISARFSGDEYVILRVK